MTTLSDTTTEILQRAVAALTQPQQIDPDAKPGVYVAGAVYLTVAPMIEQLADALEPSGGGTGNAPSNHRSPAALEVVSLLNEIDTTVARGMRLLGYRNTPNPDRGARLWTWGVMAVSCRASNQAYVNEAAKRASNWVERAREILSPDRPTLEPRAQPCPACGERTALVWSIEHGERVQKSALYLDKARMSVFCRCCPAEWGPSLWGLLAKVLSSQDEPIDGRKGALSGNTQ
jgi:hypothetical protein